MSDPFKINGPTCISFSGGRTSAYMLWRVLQSNGGLPEEAKVCFANTGKEEEATLRFVDRCSKEWDVPITWIEYRSGPTFEVVLFETASRNGEPFESVIQQRGGYLPNRVARYCSSEMKTRTMHRYLKSEGWSEWDTLIGIRADEPRRVSKFRLNPRPEYKGEEVHMPLAISNISSKDVAKFWQASRFDLELPNINGKTMHGNCDLCYLKPASQILSLVQEKPERAVWWAAMETRAESVADTASRFRTDRPSYAEMLKYAQEQRDMFDPDEEAIACFCGD
jgi:3'-phosphoadenosine 5'-phosphosulfate sulfotransferase (PAPS reductase)/FAD synthetase